MSQNVISKRKLLREKMVDGVMQWCEATVELREAGWGLELSIVGSAGHVIDRKRAREKALQGWVNFFDEQPGAIQEMNKRCGFRCTTSLGAARKVVQTDGEFHGLDVHSTDGDQVYVCTSCGQIREEMQDFFPELADLFPYHLNGMRAGCEHQRALGWGHGKTIALSPDDLTPAQSKALAENALARVAPQRAKLAKAAVNLLLASDAEAVRFYKKTLGKEHASIHDVATMRAALNPEPRAFGPFISRSKQEEFKAAIARAVEQDAPAAPFTGAIYKDCLGAPCPECGYQYGTAWLHEPLPDAIVEAAKNFGAGE